MTYAKLIGLTLLASSGSPSSCATVGVALRESPKAWPEWRRPVLVAVDASMPGGCAQAAFDGAAWWADRGVDFLVPELVPSTHPAVLGVPRRSEVGVTAGPLTPPSIGLTEWNAPQGFMHDAVVTLDFERGGCTWQVAAHELGHALGLPDLSGRDAWGNIMFFLALQRDEYVVTEGQLEQVR